MRTWSSLLVVLALVAGAVLAGCQANGETDQNQSGGGQAMAAVKSGPAAAPAKKGTPSGDFVTYIDNGRIWVFRDGSEAQREYLDMGEPAKHVTRVKAGPGRMTVKAPDNETLDAWLKTLPAGATRTALLVNVCPRPGYLTAMKDGRLWVFKEDDSGFLPFLSGVEPAKHVTMPLAGPGGLTLKGLDTGTVLGYIAAREGFATTIVDGRIWAFRAGSEEYAEFLAKGEPAKHVTYPVAGPGRMTVRGPDDETVVEYITAKPGFATRFVDGRLWVFRTGTEDLASFDAGREPAKHTTVPVRGPRGLTVKGPDMATIQEYMAAADGFTTYVVDGRIWVFRPESPEIQEFLTVGEPAKHVTRPVAGPMDMTVKAPDTEILELYLRQF